MFRAKWSTCGASTSKGQNCPNGPITFPAVFVINKVRCICATLIVSYTFLVALSNDGIFILIGAKMSELHRQKCKIAKHWDSFVPHCIYFIAPTSHNES